MRKIVVLTLSLFTLITSAQDQIEKTVGEFKTLKVYDLINVKMIKSTENKVVITGDNKRDVEVINRNGKLKIRMKVEEIYDGNDTVVKLYYTSVDVIDVNEGAEITVEDTIDQFEIDLKTQEGGKIIAELKVTYANIRSVTGGIIKATGTAKNQDVSLYTGGVYKGAECVSENSEVSIHAAGEAFVNATEGMDIRIRAGGDVYVYGDPKRVDESRVFGGRIKRM
ncbi:MAG: head GIN domain-containing protein [Bacteroidota bacterium]